MGQALEVQEYAEGQLIVAQGEPGHAMYFLERGVAQAEVSEEEGGRSPDGDEDSVAAYTSSSSSVVMR